MKTPVPDRSSPSEKFFRKDVLKIYGKFTGKYPCRSAISGLRPATLIKMRLWHRCLSVTFTRFLRTHFFKEHASGGCFCSIIYSTVFLVRCLCLCLYDSNVSESYHQQIRNILKRKTKEKTLEAKGSQHNGSSLNLSFCYFTHQ